jgi:membrane protease YdiL (CAAX protease family)
MNAGAIQPQNVFYSAFEALSPAIHEEIVYRFFVLALVLHLLKSSASPRLAMIVAVFLAIVPHSLNHLPDLFLENPAMGLFMLTATSLLFGLPMAILQIRKNLETAIAFHWFIDFARFVLGF